jgi:hypothetical protein
VKIGDGPAAVTLAPFSLFLEQREPFWQFGATGNGKAAGKEGKSEDLPGKQMIPSRTGATI